MKDPEKFGATESSVENLDDMLVQAGGNQAQLRALLQFFKEMFDIAQPFTDQKSGKIKAPGGKLPIEKLSPGLKSQIDKIDASYIETMRYTEWINSFVEGYKAIKKKLVEENQSFSSEFKNI